MASSATRDTGTKRTGSASVKIIADASLECTYLQSVNVGDTNTYTLVAYVYTSGAAVTTADLDLWYNGAEVATTFTADSPSGWYKLSGTLTGAASSRDYGVRVHSGKTVYIDDMTLIGPAPATVVYVLNSGTGGVASLDVESSVTASNFVSDVATGTSPYATTSTTVNTNLNADMLDGKHTGTSGNAVPLLDGANTWSAAQTIDANLIVNEAGSATVDFRVESVTETNMLFVDANADTNGAIYLGGTTNGVKIIKGGDITLLGTAKYERHRVLRATTSGTPASQAADIDFFTVGGLQFSSASDNYAYTEYEIPDDWDGTDIYFEVDWFPDSGAMSGTATVEWIVEYRAITEGEAVNNGTSVTLTVTDSADYAQYVTKHTRFTLAYNNANQPLTAQDHIFFKVHRNTGVANDFSGTITVPSFEIVYNSKGLSTN